MDDGQLPLSHTRLWHFCSYNIAGNEAHFVLECPPHNLVRDKFPSLFKNVVLESLNSFFSLNHQIDIGFYLTKATTLRHFKELISLKPS